MDFRGQSVGPSPWIMALSTGVQHPWIMVVSKGVSDPWISEIAIRGPKSMDYASVIRGSTSMDYGSKIRVSDPWISEIAIRSPKSMDSYRQGTRGGTVSRATGQRATSCDVTVSSIVSGPSSVVRKRPVSSAPRSGWSNLEAQIYGLWQRRWGGSLGVSTPNDAYVMTQIRHAVRLFYAQLPCCSRCL